MKIQLARSDNIKRLPIIGVIIAILILIVILGIITYTNFTSSQNQMINALRTHSLTLIRAFEAGTRTGMMGMMWSGDQIQRLIEETAKEENVDYIAIVDERGYFLAHSDPSKVGEVMSGVRLTTDQKAGTIVEESIRSDSLKSRTYQIVAPFNPVGRSGKGMMRSGMGRNMSNRWMDWCRMMSPSSQSTSQYIVLRLRMDQYDIARMQDVKRGLVTVGVLFIVGFAAFYFLLTYQSYAATNRALKNVQTFATNVVESMPNGLISLDKGGKIKTINYHASRMLELDPSNVLGQSLSSVLKRCNIDLTFLPDKDVIERRVNCHLNSRNVLPLSITSSKLKNQDGEDIGRVIILRDLRQIEELEEKLKRSEHLAKLGQMAAGIAHEMRNPLSSIKGFAQYFKKQFHSGSEQDEYTTAMMNEVDRLNRVIQDMLNFAKPMKLDLAEDSIQGVIEHSLRLVKTDLESKHIRIKKNVDSTLPTVRIDHGLMTQALLNLFLNAIEAMEDGGQLTISATSKNSTIKMHVMDDGHGILQEDKDRIFDPFFSTKADGTGLGLSIVHRIIENHGGEISLISERNKGTTFVIVLPMDR